MKTLIMGLGNDLLGDDAVGILAAGRLADAVQGAADVHSSHAAGMALLEELVGYERVIIIDAVPTGQNPPGTVREMSIDELRLIPGTSPHYIGLPEVIAIGRRLELSMPREVRILAVEICEPLEIGESLSGPVEAALAEVVRRIRRRLLCAAS